MRDARTWKRNGDLVSHLEDGIQLALTESAGSLRQRAVDDNHGSIQTSVSPLCHAEVAAFCTHLKSEARISCLQEQCFLVPSNFVSISCQAQLG